MILELTTELDAVNVMLAAIGEAPVQTLDSGLPDAEIAEQILARTSRAVQTRGWWFNTEQDYTLTPDVNGDIVLPPNVLKVDTWGTDTLTNVVQRGTKLYDRGEHTYTFTDDLSVEIVWLLDWTELPQSARDYITIKAARVFQDSVLGSNKIHAVKIEDEREALAALKEEDGDAQDANMYVDSRSVLGIWGRDYNP